jgi:hypothetical protein
VKWSVSASRAFSRCQRQYYFGQIVAWHTGDPLRKRAFLLKQAKTPALWIGNVVHSAIERGVLPNVRNGHWPEMDQIVQNAHEMVRRQFAFSQSGRYLHESKSAAGDEYCVLAIHYIDEREGGDWLDEVLIAVEKAICNLLSSKQMQAFLMERPNYRWEQNLPFKIEDTLIAARPDLLMPSRSGRGLDVVDWKVSRRASSYHFQMAVYALAARETEWLTDLAEEGLCGYVINLFDPGLAVALLDPYTVDEDALAATVNRIYESIDRIQALTEGKGYTDLDIGRFEYARSAGTCALCNWRVLCTELGDGQPVESLSDLKPKSSQLELPFG